MTNTKVGQMMMMALSNKNVASNMRARQIFSDFQDFNPSCKRVLGTDSWLVVAENIKVFFPIWLSCWCCSPGYWQFSSIHNYFIARGIILSGARGRVESVELITGKGLEAITSDANRLATGFEIVRKGINKDNRFQLALAFWIVSTDAGMWGKKFNFYDGVWWILLAGKVLFRNFKQNKSVNSDPESVKKSFLTG